MKKTWLKLGLEFIKFLIKMEDLYQVQKEMIKFLRGLGDIYPHELKREFKKLHEKLKTFKAETRIFA